MKSHYIEEPLPEGAARRKDTIAECHDLQAGYPFTRWEHTCEACWAVHLGVSVELARRDIKGGRCATAIARAEAYKQARENIQQKFEFLGVGMEDDEGPVPSKRKYLRDLKRKVVMRVETLADTLSPILHILEAKARDMEKAVAAATKVQKWLSNCPGADDVHDEPEGAKLEAEFMEASNTWQAFADRGADQGDFIKASDFTDEWFNEEGRTFRTYYVCMAVWHNHQQRQVGPLQGGPTGYRPALLLHGVQGQVQDQLGRPV